MKIIDALNTSITVAKVALFNELDSKAVDVIQKLHEGYGKDNGGVNFKNIEHSRKLVAGSVLALKENPNMFKLASNRIKQELQAHKTHIKNYEDNLKEGILDIDEASMAIAKLKAAHSMGYKWHKDIPEESDERVELESRAKKIYDEDAAKEKAEMETPK